MTGPLDQPDKVAGLYRRLEVIVDTYANYVVRFSAVVRLPLQAEEDREVALLEAVGEQIDEEGVEETLIVNGYEILDVVVGGKTVADCYDAYDADMEDEGDPDPDSEEVLRNAPVFDINAHRSRPAK